MLSKVQSVYHGYEKHYGVIPRLTIRKMDDITAATVSFGNGPSASIPLGLILEDGTCTWPSNLMLRFDGSVIVANDYQEYAREVLSKIGTSTAPKTHDYTSIGTQIAMASRYIADFNALGKEAVRIVEGQ